MDNLRFKEVAIPGQPLLPHIDCIFQDSRGLMWFGTFGGLFMYDGYQATHFRNDPDDSLSLGDNKIRSILEDQNGDLWIGTQVGLFFFDRRSRTFNQLNFSQGDGLGNVLTDFLVEARDGDIWVGSSLGLFKASLETHFLQKVKYKEDLKRQRVMALTMSREGDLYLADQFEIYRKKHDENDFSKIVSKDEITQGIAMGLHLDTAGNLWIVSGKGVYKYDTREDGFVLFQDLGLKYFARAIIVKDEMILLVGTGLLRVNLNTLEYKIQPVDLGDPTNEHKNRVSSIYHDNQDQIWIGTGLNTAFRCDLNKKAFQHTSIDFTGPSAFPEIYEYDPGIFLVPQSDGLFFLNRATGELKRFPYRPSYRISDWESGVTTFYEEEHLLWMGTMSGLFLFNKKTERFEDFESDIEGAEALHGFPLRDILRDKNGNLWVARWVFGVFTFDFKQNKLIKRRFSNPMFGNHPGSRHLYEDRKGQIWIGSRSGLIKYIEEKDSFIVYQHDPKDRESMSENTSFCIYEDTLGFIWSGSYGGGLNRLDPDAGKFRHFTTNQGLLDNNILSLLPDKSGNLWIMSFNGVSRFNPYSFKVDNFTIENGLGSLGYDAFLYGQSPYSGEFFFGGEQGIDIIHPDSIKISDYKPTILFTDFQLFNESVPIEKGSENNGSRFYLDQDISWTKQITLTHDQKVFTLEYAALDFAGPQRVQYAYQLEGFDDDWQFVDKRRNVTYTNLSPGQYTFKVKSTNADGVWNPTFASMLISITPPWWATWSAYLAYLIILVSLVYTVYFYQRRRWALKMALQFQQQEALRLKELDTIKTNLYTNITHEFRTPLTVISGMTELIRMHPKRWLDKGTTLVEHHIQKLLMMVNQMLDLQKLEAGKMLTDPRQSDIISFINYLVEPFLFLAKSKNLDFKIHHESDSVMMDFDNEKLAQIIANLLSNAIKYTDEGVIELATEIKGTFFQIRFRDTGVGISPLKLGYIFDRFYQSENGSSRRGEGTGIGLALVKELTQLMRGSVTVESQLNLGSQFILSLPISRKAPIQGNLVETSMPAMIPTPSIPFETTVRSLGPQILIIDDNLDVRKYLKALLFDQYKIYEASGGIEGIEKSQEIVPDLIICDVMMPVKDGYAVCESLHENDLTNHIPIILLTAKADSRSKVEGYKRGADAYLTKPFKSEELRAQISMLLLQRDRLQDAFQRNLKTGSTSGPLKRTDAFLARIEALLLVNLIEDKFDIPRLCSEMHVSRSQMHNKIKSLTGYSTSIYIRKIRLREARKLLLNKDLSISEIAYSTGFRDPNFFSRVYKKEFGQSPREGRE